MAACWPGPACSLEKDPQAWAWTSSPRFPVLQSDLRGGWPGQGYPPDHLYGYVPPAAAAPTIAIPFPESAEVFLGWM